MKTLRELLPEMARDFVKMVVACAAGEAAATTYLAEHGKSRICVYVLPAEFEAEVDALIASRTGNPTSVKTQRIGGYRADR